MTSRHIPELIDFRARTHGEEPFCATYRRESSDWAQMTYRQFAESVNRLAAALAAANIGYRDCVAVWGANSVAWLICDAAIQCVGAITVPIQVGLPPTMVKEQLDRVDAKAVLVDNAARMSEVAGAPYLTTWEPIEWTKFLAFGARVLPRYHEALAEVRATLNGDDAATVIFTSGTTDRAKGVLLTHGNLLANARTVQNLLPFGPDGVLFNSLPFSHVYARVSDYLQTLIAGSRMYLAPSPTEALECLRDVCPHFVRHVPYFYEQVCRRARRDQSDLGSLFGGKARRLYVGGASIPPWLFEPYSHAGLQLIFGYGLTETASTVAVSRVGEQSGLMYVIPGLEVRLGAESEVLVRGPTVTPGYWGDAEATAKLLREGWLHTGDIGSFTPEGGLQIHGRLGERIDLSTGRKFSPLPTEAAIRTVQGVEQVIVLGTGRPYPVALIYAPRLPQSMLIDMLREAQVHLPEWCRVRRFARLRKPLCIEDEELTVSLKMRRRHIAARYADTIARLYADETIIDAPAVHET